MATMHELGFTIEEQCFAACQQKDEERIASAGKITADATKESRISIQKSKLDQLERAMDEEGQLYGPGIDSTL